MLSCANLHTLYQECNHELVKTYLKASISAWSSSSSGEVSLISLGMKVSAWLLGADPMRPRLTPPLVTGHLAVSCSDSAHTALHTGLETAGSAADCRGRTVITHVSLISAGRSRTNLGSPQPQRNWQTSSEKWLLLNVRRSHEPGLMRRLGLLMLIAVRI